MKERPILFSAPMVRAILSGVKTHTRRVCKPAPEFCGGADEQNDVRCWGWMNDDRDGPKFLSVTDSRCPYGETGDRLWVRETFGVNSQPGVYSYRADWHDGVKHVNKWRPSIFMPREASRITLEIVSVRVERLQEITEADALAEGIFYHKPDGIHHSGYRYDESSPCHPTAVNAYSWIWASINGPESWVENPFVWVIEFKTL
jgi:hypothetical protein